MQNVSTPKTHQLFGPKELFPPKTPVSSAVESKINEYTYLSPMDKHMSRVQTDIEAKDVEIQKQKCDIDEMSQRFTSDDDLNSRPSCSFCHEKGHRKNRCSGSKCITSVSCGKLKLHKDEMKQLDTMKASLRKLLKDKKSLESECDKIQESIVANSKSFPQAVCGHLINSNKKKYLTVYGEEVVPLTKIINLDISILQKHYNNRVPENLSEASLMFGNIISMHENKIHSATNSIGERLKESVHKINSKIAHTGGQTNTSGTVDVPQNTFLQNRQANVNCAGTHNLSSCEQGHVCQIGHVLNSAAPSIHSESTSALSGEWAPIPQNTDLNTVSGGFGSDWHKSVDTFSKYPPSKKGRSPALSGEWAQNTDLNTVSGGFGSDWHKSVDTFSKYLPAKKGHFDTCMNTSHVNTNPNPGPSQQVSTELSFSATQYEYWHNPDNYEGNKLHRRLSNCTLNSVVKPESPNPLHKQDYFDVYEQFNVKPKTLFTTRYISQGGIKSNTSVVPLNEPDLD